MPGAHESAAASRGAKKEHARVERASRMVVCASLHGTSRPHVVATHLQSKAIIVARPVSSEAIIGTQRDSLLTATSAWPSGSHGKSVPDEGGNEAGNQ